MLVARRLCTDKDGLPIICPQNIIFMVSYGCVTKVYEYRVRFDDPSIFSHLFSTFSKMKNDLIKQTAYIIDCKTRDFSMYMPRRGMSIRTIVWLIQ